MISRLEEFLSPMANKLGNQRHLQSISNGMMMSLALIVVGSIFLIIANPPINLDIVDLNTGNIFLKAMIAWKQWAVANYNTITIPYTMTMGLIGLVTAFGVAYCLAESYQMKPAINGIISMCVFLMISAPVTDGQLSMTYLGADGLFVALIVGLISVEICRLVGTKVIFTFPASVPTAVTNFVNSLLPLAANIIIIYGLNLILMGVSGQSLPQFIMSILTPVIFGAPIVLNPILAIPFVFMPCISIGLGYLAQSIGLVSMGYIVDPSFTPFFAQGFLSALDLRNVIFMCVLIVISMVVYYPFFKVYEKSIAQKEGIEEK